MEFQRVSLEPPNPYREAAPTVCCEHSDVHLLWLFVKVSGHLFAELSPALGTRDMCTHLFYSYWDKTRLCNLVRLLHKYALPDNSVDSLEAARDLGQTLLKPGPMGGQDFSNGRLRRISQYALDVPNWHVDGAEHRNDLSHLTPRGRVVAIA